MQVFVIAGKNILQVLAGKNILQVLAGKNILQDLAGKNILQVSRQKYFNSRQNCLLLFVCLLFVYFSGQFSNGGSTTGTTTGL